MDRFRFFFRAALLAATLGCGLPAAAAEPLHGAGATFPAPLYAAWAAQYRAKTGIVVTYDAVGSGAGIDRMKQHGVDFGASDSPLGESELKAAGLVQFPMIIGGVVPVFNISGIAPGGLRLSGAVLADIYLGKVRRWNDAEIASLNPGQTLPPANITVVHRSDPSGSTWLWTEYLSHASAAWKSKAGASLAPQWPVGVGGAGNEGVASYVQRTRFSLGYVEYVFARAHNLSDAMLRNQNGLYLRASSAGFRAAAEAADWDAAEMTHQLPTDLPGTYTWPITGASFILMDRSPQDGARSNAVLRFFDWALRDGDLAIQQLSYVAIPAAAARALPKMWTTVRDAQGKSVWP